MEWKFYPANTAPHALEIVWCRFPLVEDPESPGPKSRPGLVRRTLVKGDKAWIDVAYGTSSPKNYSDVDLIIANLEDMLAMRLPQMTIFQLGRTSVIPWAEEWVGNNGAHGPKISKLTPKYCEYLARLQPRLKRKR